MDVAGVVDFADFDFDGIVKLRFDSQILPELQKKMSHWRSRFETPDLTIEKGLVSPRGFRIALNMSVSPGSYQMLDPNGGLCEIDDKRIVCGELFCTDFLSTYVVKPVINRFIVPKGNFLLRASALAVGDNIIVFPGGHQVGKTFIILEFMRRGAAYMANGDIFINRDGKCTLYSKWINLREHHLRIFPDLAERLYSTKKDSRAGERIMSFYRLGASMEGKNFVSRFAKFNLMSRFPFNQSIPSDRLFPQSKVRETGVVTHVFLLERDQRETRVIESKPEKVAELAASMQWVESQGCHNMLAGLAGLKSGTMDEIVGVLTESFDKASCRTIQIEESQTGRWVDQVANLIEQNLS
jgi:hypothetical protein